MTPDPLVVLRLSAVACFNSDPLEVFNLGISWREILPPRKFSVPQVLLNNNDNNF